MMNFAAPDDTLPDMTALPPAIITERGVTIPQSGIEIDVFSIAIEAFCI